MMTVAELVDALRKFDPSMPVAVMAYESGLTANVLVTQRLVLPNENAEHEYWDGELEVSDTGTAVVSIEREGGHRWS